MAPARCFDLVGTRSEARSRQAFGTKRFEPGRRHVRHKHLPGQDYAFEKDFSEAEQTMMTKS
jgi:hypothetical protein